MQLSPAATSIPQVVIAVSKSICNCLFHVISLSLWSQHVLEGKVYKQSYQKALGVARDSSQHKYHRCWCSLCFAFSEHSYSAQKHTLALSGKKPNLWIADAVSLLEEMHVFHFSMSLHSPLLSFFLFVKGFPKQNYSNPMISVTAFTHPLSQSSPIILMRDFMLARAAWSGMSLLRIGGTHGCVDPGTDYKAFVIQLNS